jgi:hypothetical protein
MPRVPFDQLPADARVWIFAAERTLDEPERRRLLATVDRFIDQWGAHSVPLTAGRDLRYDQFLFVAVDERTVGPSGCSIDALVRQMRMLQDELGIELVNNAPVLFRRAERIERVQRDVFADLATSGEVSLDTTVFNNALTSLADVRADRWEGPASASWHAQAFF